MNTPLANATTLLFLGHDSIVDAGVTLGYKPGRQVVDLMLRIGEHAQIRTGTIIYAGTRIGDNFQTGHNVIIREENSIGNDVSIWSNSVIDYGCVIGNNVKIHCNIYIAQFTTLEDDVFLAPGVSIANDPHPLCGRCMRGPTIKRGARIGVNVTLLPFVCVGEGSLVGAGSVVTKDIPPYTVAYGNPARAVRSIDDLRCPYGLIDQPYVHGLDVKTRGMS
jgi:acetyltransferase-like isoleucine patch superfamily enzyme